MKKTHVSSEITSNNGIASRCHFSMFTAFNRVQHSCHRCWGNQLPRSIQTLSSANAKCNRIKRRCQSCLVRHKHVVFVLQLHCRGRIVDQLIGQMSLFCVVFNVQYSEVMFIICHWPPSCTSPFQGDK